MKVKNVKAPDTILIEPMADIWNQIPGKDLGLVPSPIAATQQLSPFMALKKGHGTVTNVELKLAHNGKMIFAHLRWKNDRANTVIKDLDDFSDGAGIMFPLRPDANAFSMGDKTNPVNAWLWKADKEKPFDVYAEGWGSSRRRPAKISGLQTKSEYIDGFWHLVFQRSLRSLLIGKEIVNFTPRSTLGVAIAIWDGGNKERAAQKSFSGNWHPIEIEY
ncbi:MAG: hypothetical protein KUG73_01405 [Pseudomonadales bacterium]|nr:hypothetical protein [Pseudomonadales bacterium]